MESITNGTPSASWRKLAFVYDAQGRRIRKTVQIGNTNATWGAVIFDNLYVYNGWNLMVELNATNKAIINSYMWGADVSGTEQGAGGVGGLLKIYRPGAADNFTVYDANGNLTALVDGSSGTVSANYEYGPFGEVIRLSGTEASANPIRWSTKYTDDQTDLVYYGRRYYNPSTGRWLNRDPIGELGGLNLYQFCANDSPNSIDKFGMFSHSHHCSKAQLSKIRAAERAAKSVAAIAQETLEQKFDLPQVLKRNLKFASRFREEPGFAASYIKWYIRALNAYKAISQGFKDNDYGVECECFCTGDKLGYVRPNFLFYGLDDDIHFCESFFSATPDRQAETILHEASHMFAHTDDLVLGGGPPWEKNAQDAYWLENVATEDPFLFFEGFLNQFTSMFNKL